MHRPFDIYIRKFRLLFSDEQYPFFPVSGGGCIKLLCCLIFCLFSLSLRKHQLGLYFLNRLKFLSGNLQYPVYLALISVIMYISCVFFPLIGIENIGSPLIALFLTLHWLNRLHFVLVIVISFRIWVLRLIEMFINFQISILSLYLHFVRFLFQHYYNGWTKKQCSNIAFSKIWVCIFHQVFLHQVPLLVGKPKLINLFVEPLGLIFEIGCKLY